MLDQIERDIAIEGELDAEQRTRLMEIADKCPVHRTLTSEIRIVTRRRIKKTSDDAENLTIARGPKVCLLGRRQRLDAQRAAQAGGVPSSIPATATNDASASVDSPVRPCPIEQPRPSRRPRPSTPRR